MMQGNQLSYPLDPISKKVLQEAIRESILDIAWNDYFYYRTVFEDVHEDLINCSAGFGSSCPSSSVGPDGLSLNTETATSGQYAYMEKTPLADSGLSWGKEQRMRAGFRLTHAASQTVYIRRGTDEIAGHPYFGFKVTNASLLGCVYDGTSETTLTLKTIAADTSYLIEARYLPGAKVIFYVDGVEVGTITSGLPNPSDADKRGFYNFSITTNENVGKGLLIAFFEYIQRKI